MLTQMFTQLADYLRRWPLFELGSPQNARLGWLLLAAALLLAVRHHFGWRLKVALWPREGGAGLLGWLAWLPATLRLAGLALLVLALLRPQTVLNSTQSTVQSRDIFMVLDVSGSMQAPDLQPNRLEVAKKTLKTFVDKMPGDRLGLVVFAGKAFVQCPLTLDHGIVQYFIDQMQNGTVALNGTAVGDGLLVALARLAQEPKSGQVVVLATDGVSNTGHDPRVAAQLAAAAGVKLYTVGMGRKGGAVVQVPDMFGRLIPQRMEEPDEKTLRAMAEATGGRYFRAVDNESLQGIYDQIAHLERREVKVKNRRDADEHFYPFLWVGAFLLLLEALLRLRLRVLA
jgi:Ca-activated chloride channel family protein